jgi:hypothetical protein
MFKTPYSEKLRLEIWKLIEDKIKQGFGECEDIWVIVEYGQYQMDINFYTCQESGNNIASLYDTKLLEGKEHRTTDTSGHIILYQQNGVPQAEREKLKTWIK